MLMRLLRHHPSLAYLTTVRGSEAAGTRVRFCRGAGWIGCWIVRGFSGIRLLPMTATGWWLGRWRGASRPWSQMRHTCVMACKEISPQSPHYGLTPRTTLWQPRRPCRLRPLPRRSRGRHYYLCVPTSLRRYRGARRWMRFGFTPVTLEAHRIAVGVWIELPDSADWSHQGVSRVIGFLIEGAAQRGDIIWRLVAPSSLRDKIAEDLRTLAAREGQDWTLHCPPREEPLACGPVMDTPIGPPEPIVEAPLESPEIASEQSNPIGLTPRRMGQVLFLAGLAALPLLLLRAALRSILRAITTRLRLIVRIARDPVVFAPQLADAVARLPRGVGSKAARSLRVWALAAQVPLPAADLASSSAPEPAPDLEPAPNPGPSPELPAGPLDPAPPFRKLAKFANAEVPGTRLVDTYSQFPRFESPGWTAGCPLPGRHPLSHAFGVGRRV